MDARRNSAMLKIIQTQGQLQESCMLDFKQVNKAC